MRRRSPPRTLAFHRRKEALRCWIGAVALLLAAVIMPFIMPIMYGLCVSVLLCAGARGFQVAGQGSWQSAKRAESGAVGEDEAAKELELLSPAWSVRRNVPAEQLGDIDFIVVSPTGRQFTLEVKSHKGIVLSDHDGLFRRIGYNMYPFESDPLRAAKNQAAYVREQFRENDVTPVVVFTRAEIGLKARTIEGVHILRLDELIKWLDQQGKVERKKRARGRVRSFSPRR